MWVRKYITDIDENEMLSSPFFKIASSVSDVSDFLNDSLGNVFYKRLGTISYKKGNNIVLMKTNQ